MTWLEELKKSVNGALSADEPLSKHTTFRIGGRADAFFEPADSDDLSSALAFIRKEGIRHIVIGQGSNLLFSDSGYRGCVIRIGGAMSKTVLNDRLADVEAGAPLHSFINKLAKRGLSGLEELSGIPGSVGGVVSMNAGAFGKSISECLISVVYIDETGEKKQAEKNSIEFSYRWSDFHNNPERIITSARFEFAPENPERIKDRLSEHNERRKKMQPRGVPSAGSFFKNPEGHPAGMLIDRAGLKGLRVGGAEVSPVHANFIVNTGGATCADVLALADEVRRRVETKFGIRLLPEVKMIQPGFANGTSNPGQCS